MIYVNELILTPFSPFDIKSKKLNVKNLWKCIFRASRRMIFSYFSNTVLDPGGCPPITFRIFVDHVIIFSTSPVQHLRLSFL